MMSAVSERVNCLFVAADVAIWLSIALICVSSRPIAFSFSLVSAGFDALAFAFASSSITFFLAIRRSTSILNVFAEIAVP